MTRACPSCGSHLCDGVACYLEPDPDKTEFWANFDELRKAQAARDEAEAVEQRHRVERLKAKIARAA